MRQIANYTVEDEPIAKGGMGQILKGYDPQGHKVAIKEILPEYATDFSIISRIEREVEFMMQIDHPSIVKLYSAFRDPETQCYYIVMELVDGLNVEQYVKKNGAIPYHEATRYMTQVLQAMQQVHEANIMHRDLKPSNIMICNDSSIRLLDFGIARNFYISNGTLTGTVIGTMGYMSPEQTQGYTVNWLSDIYALGCVFFYMLTGHHAFNQLQSEFETQDAVLTKPLPKLDKYVKGIPEGYQQVLEKATAKNMMQRYMSCSEFDADLKSLIGTVSVDNRSLITLGRTQGDIILDDPECKISRHHADIELVVNTGTRYFILTDHSANGTLVGSEFVHRRSIQLPFDNPRTVRLAGVEAGLVDWDKVKKVLMGKMEGDLPKESAPLKPVKGVQPEDPAGGEVLVDPPIPEDADEDAIGWIVAAWVCAVLGGVLGIGLGIHIGTAKTNYGSHKILKYKKDHRKLGWAAAIVSPISMIIWILAS